MEDNPPTRGYCCNVASFSTTLSKVIHGIGALLKVVSAAMIRGYQWTISPDHSPAVSLFFPYGCCRYHPTCSEYARQAVLRYGALRGWTMACWRIARCNPWSQGGVDLP